MEERKPGFRTRLRSMSVGERIAAISVLAVSLTILLFGASLFIWQWDHSLYAMEFLSGVVMLLQARLHWRKNRGTAIFSLCAAGIIFVCFIIILFVN